MARLVLLFAVLAGGAPHPLASDSLATRQKAALAWAAKHGPVKLDAPDDAAGCAAVRAPKESGCTRTVWACSVGSATGSCSGGYSEESSLVFIDSDELPADQAVNAAYAAPGKALLVSAESGEDDPELECDSGGSLFGFGPGVPQAEREKARAQWAAEQARERARCIARARKRFAAERVVYRCQLLLVNPCRREAFVRCSGKNVDPEDGLGQLGVRRFAW